MHGGMKRGSSPIWSAAQGVSLSSRVGHLGETEKGGPSGPPFPGPSCSSDYQLAFAYATSAAEQSVLPPPSLLNEVLGRTVMNRLQLTKWKVNGTWRGINQFALCDDNQKSVFKLS